MPPEDVYEQPSSKPLQPVSLSQGYNILLRHFSAQIQLPTPNNMLNAGKSSELEMQPR
jgi:hypothetical protein